MVSPFYQILSPRRAELTPFVQGIQFVRGPVDYRNRPTKRIYPRFGGFWVMDFAGDFAAFGGASTRNAVHGQQIHFFDLNHELANRADRVVVLFKPAASGLMDAPARVLGGRLVEADRILPGSGEIYNRCAELRDSRHRLDVIETFLSERLIRKSLPAHGDLVAQLLCEVELCLNVPARQRITDLSGLGVRQVQRSVRNITGVSLQNLARIARFETACRAMADKNVTLAAAACAGGYYDQAQFTREFRALAGVTPGRYRRAGLPCEIST